MTHAKVNRSKWSSRWAFTLATAGSAIGLGNIWKLPYMIGINGGSAFVLIFLVCIFFVGIPLMMTEIMLGRRAQKNPFDGLATLAKEAHASKHWRLIGAAGLITGLLILGFYSVIGGWVLRYISFSVQNDFLHMDGPASAAQFSHLLASPWVLIFWHTVFMVMTMGVIARGVNAGLEKANNILIPSLFVILFILLGYSMAVGDFKTATDFMFTPDFSKITPVVVLSALGHAFFSLSLGMGSVMVYGSYLTRDVSIAKTTIMIALVDTALGLLVGLAIYSLVFANQLAPNVGPGLIFETLPIAFGNMPFGGLVGTLFFTLVAFAAWTSAISLVEPATAWMIENTAISRVQAALLIGFSVWVLGITVVLSFSTWSEVKLLFGLGIFDTLDKLTSTILLPLGGLGMAIFAGFVMRKQHVREELAHTQHSTQQKLNTWPFRLWRFSNNYLAPLAILGIFLYLFGIIQ